MAFVGGLGGNHINVQYKERRRSICAQTDVENCGCIHITLNKRKKKKNKIRLLKERMRQFSIWFFENEDHKEVEHARRRNERKKRRKMQSRGNGHSCLICLYGFDVIFWIIGLVFTVCSSVRSIGKYTCFYRSRHLYRLLGPAFLLVATLILCLATALKHRINTKNGKPKRKFYIVQKKNKDSKSDMHKDPDNDSGNEEDIEMDNVKKQNQLELELEKEKENSVLTTKSLRSGMDFSVKEQPGAGLEEENLKRVRDRRAWAKSKWMRVDIESDEDIEFDDIKDLTPTRNEHNEEEKFGNEGSTETRVAQKFSGKRRLTRFKPISGNCFSAQSSIKSQTSEVSYTSTTSESAPLFRK